MTAIDITDKLDHIRERFGPRYRASDEARNQSQARLRPDA